MGVRVEFELSTLGGQLAVEAESYSVTEQATPLAGGDSSGSVGSFSVTVPGVNQEYDLTNLSGGRVVLDYLSPALLINAAITITDTEKGVTMGRVEGWTTSEDSGTITFTGPLRLGALNVYGVQAQPFVGNLKDAFEYYLSLAGITTGIYTDLDLALIPVVIPGWQGELWYHLKQLAAAHDCEIALVSGIISLRKARTVIAVSDRNTSRSQAVATQALAQSVEVYQYNSRAITNELVYPPGGWTPEVQVLNVNAGEEVEYTLELSSSLSSFQAPTMQTFVAQDHDSSSVYTVVADDGLPVPPATWTNMGGQVSIELAPDTRHLIVRMKGAEGVPTSAGRASTSFSLALGSDVTGSRYSTLRIVGTGVAFDKQIHRMRTGIPASQTGTEVGVTIDNPFLSTVEQRCRAGVRAARMYAGAVPSLTGSVTTLLGGSGEGQQFGNLPGSRIHDRRTGRWYRIRDGVSSREGISVSLAEDDQTLGDVQTWAGTRTYGQVQSVLGTAGLFTYQSSDLKGL